MGISPFHGITIQHVKHWTRINLVELDFGGGDGDFERK
jgi:hypothetical protein